MCRIHRLKPPELRNQIPIIVAVSHLECSANISKVAFAKHDRHLASATQISLIREGGHVTAVASALDALVAPMEARQP